MSLTVDDVREILKDKEAQEDIVKFVQEIKDEVYPALDLFKEVIGKDLDKFVDIMIQYSVDKTKKTINMYIDEGFGRAEAIALTMNTRINVLEGARKLK